MGSGPGTDLDDVWAAGIFGRDGRDGDGLSETCHGIRCVDGWPAAGPSRSMNASARLSTLTRTFPSAWSPRSGTFDALFEIRFELRCHGGDWVCCLV